MITEEKSIYSLVLYLFMYPIGCTPSLWLKMVSIPNFIGSGYFAVNGILPLEAILSGVICDWSILMTLFNM